MHQERYVAAIEISSSKIIGIAGKYDVNGQLAIIASEQEENKESVRYGIIQNPEETATRVNRILEKLQRNPAVAPKRITGLFVALSGRSMRSITANVHLSLPDESEITEDILERLGDQARQTAIDSSLELVDAVPRVYTVGKTETTSPKGTLGNEISAVYDLIVCRPELRRNLERTIQDKAGIEIFGYIVTPLAAGHIVLTREEKRLGCMLVDMGAETTAVSIYKDGFLTYFAVLPLGGRNITRDLTSLSLLEERAEEIKLSSHYTLESGKSSSSINYHGIRQSDINNLITARAEEIVANIAEQINYAGLKVKDLPGGIVCIGGGARLNGLGALIERQTGLNVRMGRLPEYIQFKPGSNAPSDMLEVACVLYEGASLTERECLAEPVAEEIPATGRRPEQDLPADLPEEEEKPRGNSWFSKVAGSVQNRLGRLFAPPEDSDSDELD